MSEYTQNRRGGIERELDGAGSVFLFLAMLGFVLCIVAMVRQPGSSYLWIGLGLGVLTQGIVFWILFRAGAEIIRLLKKLNNLPFGGRISRTFDPKAEYTCDDCGAPATQGAKYCDKCGAKFIQ